jgi:aspartate racemase
MATLGTHRLKLYEPVLAAAGIRCFVPQDTEQAEVMRGIREGVKAGRIELARECFERVARALAERHDLDTVVLACTEIPLALPALPGVRLVDPAQVLARALASHAYADASQRATAGAEQCES